MTNKFEIRTTKVLSDSELSESLRGGWDENLPAIKDEYGNLLVGNRRMAIAKRDGIEPVIKVVTFGDGPEADAARIRLANVSNIGAAPMTKEDRQRQAERLHKSGLTQMAIADMLGVSQTQISFDLSNLLVTNKSKPAKTETNPKGAGRPGGSGKQAKASKPAQSKPAPKPTPVKVVDRKGRLAGVDIKGVDPEVWREFNERAHEENRSATKKIAELITSAVLPPVDPSTLSLTAQQKIRFHRQAEGESGGSRDQRAPLTADYQKWLADLIAGYREKEAHYNIIISQHGGLLKSDEYKLIWSCLHPDSRKSTSDEKLHRAFQLFTKLEKLMIEEKKPNAKYGTLTDLPTTAEGWDKLRAKVQAERAAQRAAKKKGSTNGMETR